MDRHRIGIVIPALNEARSIGDVVRHSVAHGVPVVVDDGSTDGTAEVATTAGAEVVRHVRNLGYDEALNSGFRRALELGFEWVITVDADGQHDPKTLEGIIEQLDSGADVVVGVRDRKQRFAECVVAWWGTRVWGIRDPLCGIKGYRIEVYKEHGYFDSCSSVGTELAICASVRGRNVTQIAVHTRARVGAPRFGSSIRANLLILRALLAVAAKARSLR
jgi:glycosyltransferase involved in cell wall biosynthesis